MRRRLEIFAWVPLGLFVVIAVGAWAWHRGKMKRAQAEALELRHKIEWQVKFQDL